MRSAEPGKAKTPRSVSTAFTLFVVPVTYDLVYRNRPGHGLRVPNTAEEQEDTR